MAEQALVAQLRVDLSKFDADLRKATQGADRATAGISKALGQVENATKPLPGQFQRMGTEVQRTSRGMDEATKSSGRFSNALSTMKGALGALGIALSAQQIVRFGSDMVKAAEAMTGVNQQLIRVTGNAQAAAREMAFIRAETNRLALNTVDGAKGFARLANAAQGTKIEGEGLRQLFTALNTVTRANRLSQEQYGNMLNQVTQIISKGRVQTEELITLAENGIPAFTLLAQSMSITGTKLSEMLQKGQVSSDNLLLLANKINQEYSALAEQAANTIPAKFARGLNQVSNEFIDLAEGILRSGELINAFQFKSNILDIFPPRETITAWVDEFIRQLTLLGELASTIFFGIKKVVVATFTSIVSDIKSVLGPIDAWMRDKFEKIPGLEKFREMIGLGVEQGVDQAKKAVQSLEKDKSFQGLLATIIGVEGKDINERLQKSINKLREMFGLKALPMLDAKNVGKEAKAASEKLSESYKQSLVDLKKFAVKTQPLIDVVTEADAAKTIASMRKRVRRQEIEEEERQLEASKKRQFQLEKKHAETVADMNARIQRQASEDAAAVEAAFEKSKATGIAVLPPIELTAAEKKHAEATEKIFDNMRENIQRSLANTISDILRRDIDNVKDVGLALGDAFVDTFINTASESLAAWAMSALDAPLKKLQNSLSGVAPTGQAAGAPMSTGGMAMGALGGIAGGAALGMGVADMAGGGRMGGAMGGAVGGMVAGGTIGTLIAPGIGTVIGAAAGAVIGGVIGGFMSKDKEKTSLITQTGLGMPSGGGPSARSPFGIISLFEESKASMEVASAATLAISEIDTAIAGYLNESQRTIVQGYFQSAVPEGSLVQSAEIDDAIAKAVQLRLFHAITAISDEATAKNVVGEAFSATAGSIQQIQQRAMEALGILKMIEEFRVGPLSGTAQAIKDIKDQFMALIDQATSLGLPVDEIIAEQQRLIAEVATNVNEQVANETMAILDPVGLQFKLLAEEERMRVQEAIDAGADVAAVQRLYALKRVELERETGNAINSIQQQQSAQARASIMGAIFAITDPFQAAMLGINQQVAAFEEQVAQGLIPQTLVDQFARVATAQAQEQERERRRQESEQRRAQQQTFVSAFNELANPLAAAMGPVNEQIRQFQQMVGDGIIPRQAFEQFRRLALGQAQIDRALQAISGGPATGIEQIGDAFATFIRAGRPLSDSQQRMQQLTDEFANLASAADILGLSTKDLERSYRQQARAIREEAIKAIDESLQPRREALAGIDRFLAAQRMDSALPAGMQLTEARAQLKARIGEGDVSGAVQAAEVFQNLAKQQFGGTGAFFGVQKDVQNLLSVMRERETANIERERARLIRNEERSMQQIEIGRNSVDYLRRISNDNSNTSRGIEQLIAIGRVQAAESSQVRQLLTRVVSQIRA